MSKAPENGGNVLDKQRWIETLISKKRFTSIRTALRRYEVICKQWVSRIDARSLDQTERILGILFYIFLAARMISAYLMNGHVEGLIYLLDQFVVLIFFVFRRATANVTKRLRDLLVCSVGFTLPLLIGPISPQNALVPPMVAMTIMFLGGGIYLLSKLTLRRSFGIIPANRGIKTSGLYRVVRHPMYLGYSLSLTGLLLSGPNFTNLCLALLTFVFFVWRISAEERLLTEDPGYQEYKTRTRFRLFPGVY